MSKAQLLILWDETNGGGRKKNKEKCTFQIVNRVYPCDNVLQLKYI